MIDSTQSRLLRWAALFLFLQSLVLTLSPAVRERTWEVNYRWSHWTGFFVWIVLFSIAHQVTTIKLPERDPYLLPAASLLSGWGLITIWRLDEIFGLRQTLWLAVSISILIAALWFPLDLIKLRRYKYVLLGSGLLITISTLVFGTNPLGAGPSLWLGCCGVYFQPSEPLKLLLVIYLAAYLSDRASIRLASLPLLIPTLAATGISLLLLTVQRDLGTASIFIFLFTTIIFLATGRRRIMLGAAVIVTTALILGYLLIGIIQVRVNGWINPWQDPSGASYQIVQSLLAVANGGTFGRGLGLGSPLLVPVAISDFIFAAIAEENGLVGILGLLIVFWLIMTRGMIAALKAPDRFRRYLAAGVVSYFGIQSLMIMGGNLRLIPLTGVTLPFVSYGGSSLLTSFIALYLLMRSSNIIDEEPAPLENPKPYSLLMGILAIGMAAVALGGAWWAIFRSDDLLSRTDNARRSISDRYVPRGDILDRNNNPINITTGSSGSYERNYLVPSLAPITGYTHPIYGQAGLEAALDDYLRGLKGNPSRLVWLDHLLYGTPPSGLDVRLSLDLSLQKIADGKLSGHTGSVILLNAQTGEILVMASHPGYDPNELDQSGKILITDSSAPLVNRALQGRYPLADILNPLADAEFNQRTPSLDELQQFYVKMGLTDFQRINVSLAGETTEQTAQNLLSSPYQISLIAGSLSNHGILPAGMIAMAVNTPEQGWVVLSSDDQAIRILDADKADSTAQSLLLENTAIWSKTSFAAANESTITWLIAGTVPDWEGIPVALAVTLEENNPGLAEEIRDALLNLSK